MKKILCLLLWMMLTCGTSIMAQTPRIMITKFEYNPMSLIAKMDPVRDGNGEDCAVIRFFVSDKNYHIDEALRTDTLIGEMRTWIPAGTKRLTIRHEGMLLEKYVIPMIIESKATYEATVETSLTSPVVRKETSTHKKDKTTFFYLGAGYNVILISGPSITLGMDIKHHQIELGGIFGLSKSDDLFFYNNEGDFVSAYNYQPMRLQMRYGYEVELVDFLSMTPQVGIAYNMATGKDVAGYSNTNDKYQKVNSFSALGAVRLTAALSHHFKLQVTPEYDFGVYKNLNCKWIGDVDKTVKSWTDGFSLNVGLMVFF